MNQALSLNIDSIKIKKSSEPSQGSKGLSNDNESKGFSAELEKRVDESAEANAKAKSAVSDKKELKSDKRQAEDDIDKNGNSLPSQGEGENGLSNELSDINEEILLGQEEPVIATGEGLVILSSTTQAEILKESKKISKDGDVRSTAVVTNIVIEAVKKSDDQGKSTATAVIRPDILKALSHRVVSKEALEGESKGVKFTPFVEGVIGEKQLKTQANSLDIEQQIKPDSTLQSKMIDKGVSASFASTLSPTTIGQASTNTGATATRTEVPVLDIQPTVQSKAWGKVVSSRVVWMAQEGIQQAALRLNPGSLGSIDVKLSMQNELVNISFVTHSATTRDALEQALPKLRESLDEKGLELADADVSQQESFDNTDEDADKDSMTMAGGTIADSDNAGEHEKIISENNEEQGLSLYA